MANIHGVTERKGSADRGMIKTYSKEEIMEMSMVEIAFEILKEEKQPVSFHELVKRIADMKELSEKAAKARIAYFYTDMNIDGRFVSLGDNKWGLKSWYPVESSEEELGATNKPTKRKKAVVEDDDFDDYDDDLDEEDYDELDVDDEFVDEEAEDEDEDEEEALDYEDDEEEFPDEDDEDAEEELEVEDDEDLEKEEE